MLAFILGTGMDAVLESGEIFGYRRCRKILVQTSHGYPSEALTVYRNIEGEEIAFLRRHGAYRRYSPDTIPHHANATALNALGVTQVASVGTCGSLTEKISPGAALGIGGFRLASGQLSGNVIGITDLSYPRVHESIYAPLPGAAVYAEIPFPLPVQGFLMRQLREAGADLVGMTLASEYSILSSHSLSVVSIGIVTDSVVGRAPSCWDQVSDLCTVVAGDILSWWRRHRTRSEAHTEIDHPRN